MSIKSEIFNWDFSDNVPAIVGIVPGQVTAMDYTVPPRCRMTLKSFGNTCGTLLAWGVVYWRFYRDGYFLYPYNQVFDQLGFETGRQDIQNLVVEGGHNFQIIMFNPTAGIVNMGVSLTWELEYLDQDT